MDNLDEISTISDMKNIARMLNIPGYSKYKYKDFDTLKNLIIRKIKPTEFPDNFISDVKKETTITRMKTYASTIGIKGSAKYKLCDIDTLRSLILKQLNEVTEEEEPVVNETFFNKYYASSAIECLKLFSRVYHFQSKGTYGSTYVVKYKNKEVIFKLVDLEFMGAESFKWECTIAEKASKIEAGPKVIETGICYKRSDEGEIPLYGILVMEKCKIVGKLTDSQLLELIELINKLHDNGIIHRDLAMRNIMCSSSTGKLLVIDYGLAFLYDSAETIPLELKLFDLLYLFSDISKVSFLNSRMTKNHNDIIRKLGNDIVLIEKYSATYFPLEMLKTMKIDYAKMYLNKLHNDHESLLKLDKILDSRYKKIHILRPSIHT